MSVIGKSLKDTTPVEVAQPVMMVNAAGAQVAPAAANSDGSVNQGGVNGTGRATAANPAATRDYGSATIAAGQVSAGTTSTQIVAARSGRMAVTIVNGGTNDVFIGVTGVTITTGVLLPGTKGASVTIPTQAAVFGVAAVAQTVSFIETF